VPAGVNITNLLANSLTVNWSASTDNVAVTDYQVFRNGSFLATVASPTLTFNDSGLVSATFCYTVAACDLAGGTARRSRPRVRQSPWTTCRPTRRPPRRSATLLRPR
jgi:chitodextrinase